MARFLSDEWITSAHGIVERELANAPSLQGVDTSVLGVITGVPPSDASLYLYLAVAHGTLAEFSVGADPLVRDRRIEFTITGDYGTFASLMKGELGLMTALLRKRVTFDGDRMRALRLATPLQHLIGLLRAIPTEYED